ncbi:MAG TPA: hypothetical protein DCS07_02010 [Bdellovibrionales bacterium]|nr:MAG: hypothetical protein A2X97_09040 [Bdellovibrionales bacterium GWA1_52_35]OFZ40156.1 MAG: hypothetical protein A2070_02330 [Bdellovibrionales bacterium GWC1_52_8]HAR41399.1 hypothetical protein [Bdellovibrionales bacterium]HCM41170.1 hypothetical protein [Bdellovibrionales bacterium]
MKFSRNIMIALLYLALAPMNAHASELVAGSYDQKNDWLVFQWSSPEYGLRTAMLDSGNKVKPSIHASVLPDGSGSFLYAFEIGNLLGASQLLQHVYISHPSSVTDAKAPAPQSEWDMGEYKNQGIWSWTKVLGSVRGIPAGQTVKGFAFKSKGLPSIVDAKFSGKRRVKFSGPGDEDPDGVQESFDRVYANLKAQYPDKFADTVKQKTVGPIDPPASFNHGSLIQNLILLVSQARLQGWIDNDGIENSFTVKLNNAQSKISAGDMKTAKNVLGAFMSDVQAQNGKHLSAEAYALLYFNAKYIVDHL